MKEGEEKKLGRPSIYDAEKLAEELHAFVDNEKFPMIEAFCLDRNKPCKDTVYELAKKCSNLSDAITRANMKRYCYLYSPDNEIHPKTTGIMLASHYGEVEKQQIDMNASGNQVIEIKLASEEK